MQGADTVVDSAGSKDREIPLILTSRYLGGDDTFTSPKILGFISMAGVCPIRNRVRYPLVGRRAADR